MYSTTVEATKGEQIKVTRWLHKPETKLLAAATVREASYLTVDLQVAPKAYARQQWVQVLQQATYCACGGRMATVWLQSYWHGWVQLTGCPACDGPAPLEYLPGVSFGLVQSMPETAGVSLPAAPNVPTEAVDAPCAHCGQPLKGSHYATGACFTGAHSYAPAPAGLVPYVGSGVAAEGEQVHRTVGEYLDGHESPPEGQRTVAVVPLGITNPAVQAAIENAGGVVELQRIEEALRRH